ERRVDKLRAFWEGVTSSPVSLTSDPLTRRTKGTETRYAFNQLSALSTVAGGVRGFFKPRMPSPWVQPRGSLEATSYYDTSELRGPLERLVDFDRINAAAIRFSVGAVDVESGNFVYFDTRSHIIRAEHVMASGALPPGLPPIGIEGTWYWDGGLV